jgi:Xaa-Pro aminopeptidase
VSDRGALVERLVDALGRRGLTQAVLSSPETLAHLVGFAPPYEDWPIADPFTAAPPLLLVQPGRTVLVVPTLHALYAQGVDCEVVESRTHRFRGTPPDPWAELATALAGAGVRRGPTGVQGRSLPAYAHELLRGQGAEAVWIDDLVLDAERIKLPVEVEAIRGACRMADVIQRAVKDRAEAGQSEAELAGIAQAEMFRAAGRRIPAVLTLNTGEASARGSTVPGDRMLRDGDLVLTDTSPWVDGAWADTANAVVVGGRPTAEHRRAFDALRATLELAIGLCRPGAVAGEVDRRVRASLSAFGDAVYPHHTGHGIGTAWYEAPYIIPGSPHRLEEGMVLAVEPALYRPGWGGIRLEHVFRVGVDGNEILSRFEHAL